MGNTSGRDGQTGEAAGDLQKGGGFHGNVDGSHGGVCPEAKAPATQTFCQRGRGEGGEASPAGEIRAGQGRDLVFVAASDSLGFEVLVSAAEMLSETPGELGMIREASALCS